MRLILSICFLAVVVFLLLIVSQNQHLLSDRLILVLDLSYIQLRFHPVRIDLLLIAVFAAGFSLATMLGAPSRVKGTLERRKLRKQVTGKSTATTASHQVAPASKSDAVDS